MGNFKKFGPIAKLAIQTGLNIAENRVDALIPDSEPNLQKGANIIFKGVEGLLAVLSDDDFNNVAQVRTVVLETINVDVVNFIKEVTTPLIDKIEDEHYQKAIAFAAKTVLDLLSIVTDKEDDNNEQFKAYFTALVRSDDFLSVVSEDLILGELKKVLAPDVFAGVAVVVRFVVALLKSGKIATTEDTTELVAGIKALELA